MQQRAESVKGEHHELPFEMLRVRISTGRDLDRFCRHEGFWGFSVPCSSCIPVCGFYQAVYILTGNKWRHLGNLHLSYFRVFDIAEG